MNYKTALIVLVCLILLGAAVSSKDLVFKQDGDIRISIDLINSSGLWNQSGSSHLIPQAAVNTIRLPAVGPGCNIETDANSDFICGTDDTGSGVTPGTAINVTDLNSSGQVVFSNLLNCDTIDTDGDGVLSCGTDDGGSSGVTVLSLALNISNTTAYTNILDHPAQIVFDIATNISNSSIDNSNVTNNNQLFNGAGYNSSLESLSQFNNDGVFVRNVTDDVKFNAIWGGTFHTNGFMWNVTNDGSNMVLNAPDVGGNNYFGIETTGGFFQLYANPNAGNDFLLATIAETQGADTDLNFYEGGTGHNRFWDSGSGRFGGPVGRLCNVLDTREMADCDTGTTGADVIIQDELVNLGAAFFVNGTVNITDTSDVRADGYFYQGGNRVNDSIELFSYRNNVTALSQLFDDIGAGGANVTNNNQIFNGAGYNSSLLALSQFENDLGIGASITNPWNSTGTSIFTNDSNALIGIGTISPTELLHIKASTSDVLMKLEENGAGSEYFNLSIASTGNLAFITDGGVTALRLRDTDGEVRIASELAGQNGGLIRFGNDALSFDAGEDFLHLVRTASEVGELIINNDTKSIGLVMRTFGNNQTLTIDGVTGKIGINNSKPVHNLHVIGNIFSSKGLNASSVNGTVVEGTQSVCIAGDCRTVWPAGGGVETILSIALNISNTSDWTQINNKPALSNFQLSNVSNNTLHKGDNLSIVAYVGLVNLSMKQFVLDTNTSMKAYVDASGGVTTVFNIASNISNTTAYANVLDHPGIITNNSAAHLNNLTINDSTMQFEFVRFNGSCGGFRFNGTGGGLFSCT